MLLLYTQIGKFKLTYLKKGAWNWQKKKNNLHLNDNDTEDW